VPSGFRPHNRTAWPTRARWIASAVPQLPLPRTATDAAIREPCRRRRRGVKTGLLASVDSSFGVEPSTRDPRLVSPSGAMERGRRCGLSAAPQRAGMWKGPGLGAARGPRSEAHIAAPGLRFSRAELTTRRQAQARARLLLP